MNNPKIEEFIAPVRAIRILKAEGLITVREVAGCTDEELLALPEFGRKSLLDVRAKINELLNRPHKIYKPLPMVIWNRYPVDNNE